MKHECGRKGLSEGTWIRSLDIAGETEKGDRCEEPDKGGWRIVDVDAGPELIR